MDAFIARDDTLYAHAFRHSRPLIIWENTHASSTTSASLMLRVKLKLLIWPDEDIDALSQPPLSFFNPVRFLHGYGINLRHLGAVYQIVKSPKAKLVCLVSESKFNFVLIFILFYFMFYFNDR
jgi:hypothetical protein